jgi:Replication-relaxation
MLTRSARLEIERLQWPEGRPDRPAELPPSAPVHQLATHDLFAAFLRAGNPTLGEGIFAWLPERACGQLFGFLRADALAGVRVEDRTLTMFIERDLGTERGEVLAERCAVTGRSSPERQRRRSRLASSSSRPAGHPRSTRLRAGTRPLGSRFSRSSPSRSEPILSVPAGSMASRNIRSESLPAGQEVLTPGCLHDPDAMSTLDDRGAAMLPALVSYLRT